MNKKLVSDVAYAKDLDVVFLGDAAIEEWNGRWLGSEKEELNGIKKNFKSTFSVAGGGEVNGLALGVAGDTVSVWRVNHWFLAMLVAYQLTQLPYVVHHLRLPTCAGESNTVKFPFLSTPKFGGFSLGPMIWAAVNAPKKLSCWAL